MRITLCLLFFAATSSGAVAGDAWHDPQSIRDAVIEFILKHGEPATRYEIAVEAVDARLRLPVCGKPLDVRGNAGFRPAGTVTVMVRCNAARGWMTYVPARIRAHRKIVVLANAVLRGSTIRERDLELREYDVGGYPFGYFSKVDDVAGKTAKRSLVAGTVLTPAVLKIAPWITRGETVTLLVNAGGLQVRAQGEALSDGSENKPIKARNILTGKIVEGHVVGPGLVKVSM